MGDDLLNNLILGAKIIEDPTEIKTTSVSNTAKKETVVVNFNFSGNQNEINLLLKSPEFLKLSKEEQIAELIKRFPSVEPDILKELIKDVPSNTVVEMAEPLEQEIITEEQRRNFQKFLKTNVVDENDRKKQFEALIATLPNFDDLLSKEYLESDHWKNMSPTQKLEKRMDAFLATKIPNYNTLPEGERSKWRNDLRERIGQIMFPDWNAGEGLSEAEKNYRFQMVALGAEAREENGVSLKDMIDKMQTEDGKKEMDQMFQQFAYSQFEKALLSFDVTDEAWQSIPTSDPDKKIEILAKQILSNFNVNLTPEAEKELIEKWEDQIGKKLYGSEWSGHQIIACKRSLMTQVEAFSFYKQQHPDEEISLEKFQKNVSIRAKALNEYEKELRIIISPQQRVIRQIQIETNNANLTFGDILKYIKTKVDNEVPLSKHEQELYDNFQETFKFCKENNLDINGFKNTPIDDPSMGVLYIVDKDFNYAKLENNPETREQLDQCAKELGLGDADTLDKEMIVSMRMALKSIIAEHNAKNPNDPWDIDNLSDDAINKLGSMMYAGTNIKALQWTLQALGKDPNDDNIDAVKKAYINFTSNINQRLEASKCLAQSDELNDRKMSARNVGDGAKIAEETADPELMEKVNEAQNCCISDDNKYAVENAARLAETYVEIGLKKETISDLETYALNDDRVSNKTKAIYHDKTMELAPNDETRKYYTEQAAQNAKSADTLEIVAAGTKHIKDETIKTESQKVVVDTATQKFPDEAPRVQEAAKTGQVSAETLAKPPVKPAADDSKTQSTKKDETKPADKQQSKADNASDTKANQPKTQQAQTSQQTQQTSAATANTTTASHNEVQQNFGTPANSGNVSTSTGSVGQSATQSYSEQVIVPTPVQNASTTSNIGVVAGGNASQLQAFDGVPATNGSSPIVGDTTQPATPVVDSSVQVYSDNTVSDNQVLGSENASAKVQDNQAVTSEGQEVQSDEVENTNAAASANVPAQNPATANEATALAVKTKEELLNKIDQMIQHIKATNKPVGSSHLGEVKLSAAEAEKVAHDMATGLLEVSDIQNLSADEKTVVKEKLKQIFHNSTLSEAYEVIGSYLGESAKTKFVEVLAKKGDHDKIISFARSRAKEGNVAVVLRLFDLTSSSGVRMALLPLLPADTLLTLLGQHKIDEYDLAKVNPALLVSTLKKASSSTLNKEKLEKIANIISAEYQGTIRSIIAQNFPENSADIPGSDAWFRKIQANQRAKNRSRFDDDVQPRQAVAKADNKSESQNLSEHYDPLTSADVDEQIRAQIAGVSVSELHRRVEENERQERLEEEADGLNIASNQIPNWKRRGRGRFNPDIRNV